MDRLILFTLFTALFYLPSLSASASNFPAPPSDESSAAVVNEDDNVFSDLLSKTLFSGEASFKLSSNSGRHDAGSAWITRLFLNLDTNNLNDLSLNAGIYFQEGDMPKVSDKRHGLVNGPVTKAGLGSSGQTFGLSHLYASYHIEDTKTHFALGKINLRSPLNDSLDRGIGAYISSQDLLPFSMLFSIYESSSTASLFHQGLDGIVDSSSKSFKLSRAYNSINEANKDGKSIYALGNMLIYASIYGMKGLGWEDSALKYNLSVDYLYKLSTSIFLELDFLFTPKHYLKLQTTFTLMDRKPFIKLNLGGLIKTHNISLSDYSQTYALTRGLSSIEYGFKEGDFNGRLGGFTSFGAGYGVAFSNHSSLSQAGFYWSELGGASDNGFSMFGQGKHDQSTLYGTYLHLAYEIIDIYFNVDVVGIFGRNKYKIHSLNDKTKDEVDITKQGEFIKSRNFVEISPRIGYQFGRQGEIYVLFSALVGNIQAQHVSSGFIYKF